MTKIVTFGLAGILLLVVGVIALGPSASEAWHLRELTPEQKAEYKAWKTQPLNLPAEALAKVEFSAETEAAVGKLRTSEPADVGWEITPAEAAELRARHADLMEAFETMVNQPDYQLSAMMIDWDKEEDISTNSYLLLLAAARIELAEARQMMEEGKYAQAVQRIDLVARACRHDRYSSNFIWITGSSLLKNTAEEWNRLLEDPQLDGATLRLVLTQIDQAVSNCPAYDPDLPGLAFELLGMMRLMDRDVFSGDTTTLTGRDLNRLYMSYREPSTIWDVRFAGHWFHSMVQPVLYAVQHPSIVNRLTERNEILTELAALREAAAARLGTLSQANITTAQLHRAFPTKAQVKRPQEPEAHFQ